MTGQAGNSHAGWGVGGGAHPPGGQPKYHPGGFSWVYMYYKPSLKNRERDKAILDSCNSEARKSEHIQYVTGKMRDFLSLLHIFEAKKVNKQERSATIGIFLLAPRSDRVSRKMIDDRKAFLSQFYSIFLQRKKTFCT